MARAAEDADLDAQYIVQEARDNGLPVIRASMLLVLNEGFIRSKEYNSVLENLEKIKDALKEAVAYRRKYLLLTRADMMFVLLEAVVLTDEDEKEKDLERIRKLKRLANRGDLQSADEDLSKLEKDLSGLKEEFIGPWCILSLQSLGERNEKVSDLVDADPKMNSGMVSDSLLAIRGHLEQVEILVNYEDFHSAMDLLEKALLAVNELEDILVPEPGIDLPETLVRKIQFIEDEMGSMEEMFSQLEDTDALLKEMTRPRQHLKLSVDRYLSESIDEMEAHQELDKVRLMLDDIKTRSMEGLRASIISRTGEQIEAARAKDIDVTTAGALFEELESLFAEGDIVMARELGSNILKLLEEARTEKVRATALAFLSPIDTFLNGLEEQGQDITQARHYITLSKIELERGDYARMKDHANRAKALARKARDELVATQVVKYLGPTEVIISSLEGEKVEMEELRGIVRDAKEMFHGGKVEKGIELAGKASGIAESLYNEINEKRELIHRDMGEAERRELEITKPVSAELLELQAECMNNIQSIQRLAISVAEFGADDSRVMKFFDRAQKAFNEQNYSKAQQYVVKSANAAKTARIGYMKSLLARVEKAGVDIDYLHFLLEHAEFAFENGEMEMGEEYVCNFMDTIGELKTSKPEIFGGSFVEDQESEPVPVEELTKTFCKFCGVSIERDSVFCPKCGQRQ